MRYRRMALSLLWIAAGVYAGLCLVFLVFQRSFLYMPTPLRPEHAAAISLEVDGSRLLVSCRPHEGDKALVYFGGNAEDVAFTLPELTHAFPDRAVYCLHYRGYSGASGRPTEASLRGDARALFRFVHARHRDVLVVGRSLGSSLAIQLAAEEPVSRLVLVTPFESILAIAQRVAPFLPMRLLLRDRFESWRYAARVGCPTLVLTATDDQIVPAANTQNLLRCFRPGVATLHVIDGTTHNSLSETTEYWHALVDGR